jgi:hypothetical protein
MTYEVRLYVNGDHFASMTAATRQAAFRERRKMLNHTPTNSKHTFDARVFIADKEINDDATQPQ